MKHVGISRPTCVKPQGCDWFFDHQTYSKQDIAYPTDLDQLSWDAFNEGTQMIGYVEQYKRRFGFYPAELLADQVYCTRGNRAKLKEMGVQLIAKPLGRPSAVPFHVSPGERNPIEGSSGRPKQGTG